MNKKIANILLCKNYLINELWFNVKVTDSSKDFFCSFTVIYTCYILHFISKLSTLGLALSIFIFIDMCLMNICTQINGIL